MDAREKLIVNLLFVAVKEFIDGADGTVLGVDDTLLDAKPSPATFTAFILIGYAVPFVRPVIVNVFPETVAEMYVVPSVEYLYPVIEEPPSDVGGVKLTTSSPFPGAIDAIVGAPGGSILLIVAPAAAARKIVFPNKVIG